MRLWPGGDRRSCCSPGALQRARGTAAWLGLPHHLVDREAVFAATVVEPFVRVLRRRRDAEPLRGLQPHAPGGARALADELGLARVATGHYARLVWRDGEPFVARGADRAQGPVVHALGRAAGRAGPARVPAGRVRPRPRRGRPPRPRVCRRRPSPRARRSASPWTATGRSSRSGASRRSPATSSTGRAGSSAATRGTGATRWASAAGWASPADPGTSSVCDAAAQPGRRRRQGESRPARAGPAGRARPRPGGRPRPHRAAALSFARGPGRRGSNRPPAAA